MPDQEDEASWVMFTIRLPKHVHRWLKYEAFFNDTTMSAIVREEIEDRMRLSSGAHPASWGHVLPPADLDGQVD